jgi:4-amino-4-deoxy-L-arabinose transferase-like glycosyltransferase
MAIKPRVAGAPLLSAAILAAAVALLFVTAPKHEDFWWTDAATFALNGELIRDYFASGFAQSPMTFAQEWFMRYPALTIGFYPPIFPAAEAIVFALFGFSHPAAQATVAAFSAVAAYGAYLTARPALPPLAAAAAALLIFATPDVLLWSRQVMMELPALAFLLLAAAAFLRYQSVGGTRRLLLAVLLVLCAVYTKQTEIFAAPAFIAALLIKDGLSALRNRSCWLAAALGAIGLLPLVAFSLVFASQLIDTAAGQAAHLSFAAFTTYARALPEIVGWPSLIGALGYFVLLAVRGLPRGAERQLVTLMIAWFVADYLFISTTAHFEPRYGLALAVPPAILSVLLVTRLAGRRLGSSAALAAGATLFGVMIATHHVNRMSGYDAVAAFVLDHSAQDDVVLFHGNESKNFVFSVRMRSPSPKIYIARAEKFLVKYSIIRDYGITDNNLSSADIAALIDRKGISTVVLQPDFWTDQPSIMRLQALVYSDRFEQIAEFPITADEPSQRTTIKIFKNRHPVPPTEAILAPDRTQTGNDR